jgi:mRNA interferase RelE/StbE
MRRITYSRDAEKTLRSIPANARRLIITKIEQYAVDPMSSANNMKALKGESGYFRLRVGDWRILFQEDGSVVAVTKIASRGSAYS